MKALLFSLVLLGFFLSSTAHLNSFDDAEGTVCVVSGRTNIQTFDGLIYQHDEIGDFVIAKKEANPLTTCPSSYEIQIRKSQCEDSTKRTACITAIAYQICPCFSPCQTMTLRYDREANDFIFEVSGQIVPAEFMFELISKIEPNVGLQFLVPEPNSGNTFAIVQFYKDEDIDPIMIIHGFSDAWINTTGMCGTFDSDHLNDFITPDGKFTLENASFTTEWRVHGAQSLFEKYQYFDNFDPMLLTLRQPINQEGWTSQAKKNSEPELSEEAVYFLCAEACETGESASAWINKMGASLVCADYCDEVSSELSGWKFNVHYDYSRRTPPVFVAPMNKGQKAQVRIPMGGTYVFAVETHDCCNITEPVNVTLQVKCSSNFEVNAGDDISLSLEPFPRTLIRLEGKIDKLSNKKAEDVHISWQLIEWPTSTTPKLVYPYSLTPYLELNFVGNYVLELTAFDGCHLSKDRMNITVECLNTDLFFVTQGQQVKWVWDGYSLQFSQVSTQFAQCSTIPNPLSLIDTNLTWITSADPLLSIVKHSRANFEILYQDTIINTTLATKETYLPDQKNDTAWQSVPPRNGFVRTEAEYSNVEIHSQRKITTLTNETEEGKTYIPECRLYPQYMEGKVTWEVSQHIGSEPDIPDWANTSNLRRLAHKMQFGMGLCAGRYNVTHELTTLYGCSNTILQHELDVSCGAKWTGPLAKPLVPCTPVQYDYLKKECPVVTLYTDTSDRWERHFLEKMNILEIIPDSAYIDEVSEGRYQMDRPAHAKIGYVASNGCQFEETVIDLSCECVGDISVNLVCPPALVYNYSDPSANVFHIESDPISTAKLPDGTLAPIFIDDWACDYFESEPYTVYDNSPIIDIPLQNILKYYQISKIGAVSCGPVATDHCLQKLDLCPMLVTCDNEINVVFSIINQSNVLIQPIYDPYSTGDSYVVVQENSTFTKHPILERRLEIYSEIEPGLFQIVQMSSSTVTIKTSWPPGDYFAKLDISDGCHWVKGTPRKFTLKAAQNTIKPYITISQTITIVENNTVVHASATNSRFIPYDDYDYRYLMTMEVISPSGIVIDQITQLVNKGDSIYLALDFIPTEVGDYAVQLNMTDGSQLVSESVLVHSRCGNLVVARATVPSEVTWGGNKFPMVSLDGKDSTWSMEKPNYYWEVIEAPKGSLFEGRHNIFTETIIEIQDPIIHATNNTGEHFSLNFYSTENSTITYQKTTYKRTRLLHEPNSIEIFGSCFRPDLPGKYVLELQLDTVCSHQTSEVIVKANCNREPSVNAEVPSTALAWEQVSLDASGTTDPDSDDLSFKWTVVECQTLTDLSVGLFNSMSSKAIYSTSLGIDICISLEVSDGCNVVKKEWTLKVSCGPEMPEIEKQELSATFNGFDLQQVNMEIPINDDVDASWYNTHYYHWTLTGYDPTPIEPPKMSDGEIAGIVVGVVAGVALVAAIIAAAVVMLMGASGAEGSEIAFTPKASTEMSAKAS